MDNKNGFDKAMGIVEKVAPVIGVAAGPAGAVVGVAGAVVAPVADVVSKIIIDKIEDDRAMIDIPPVILDEGYVKLKDAKDYLEDAGLKVGNVVAKPRVEFRECGEFDVVGRSHKQKKRVPPGTRVILQYVTAEVIEKSKQMFYEQEREKEAIKQKKLEERLEKTKAREEQAALNKQKATEAFMNIQQRILPQKGGDKKLFAIKEKVDHED